MNTTQSLVYYRPSPRLRGATRRCKMWEYVLSAIIGWNVNSVKWNDANGTVEWSMALDWTASVPRPQIPRHVHRRSKHPTWIWMSSIDSRSGSRSSLVGNLQ